MNSLLWGDLKNWSSSESPKMTPVSFIVTAFIQFTLYHFHKDFFFLISESFRSMLLNVQTCFSFSFSFFFFFSLTYYILKKWVLPETVDLKKYSQPESWELYFNWWEFLGLQVQETASQVTPREQLWESEGSTQVIYKFCNKGQVARTSKDYCFLKKPRYPRLRKLVLFYVWKDTRVWAHWNHFFDVHLTSLGPVTLCFSHSEFHFSSMSDWSLMAARLEALAFLSAIRAHELTLEGCSHWHLWHPLCWYGRKYSISQNLA